MLNLLAVILRGIIISPLLMNIEFSKNLKVLSWCDAELIKYIQQLACNRFLNVGSWNIDL
jgi:hypothetical protein